MSLRFLWAVAACNGSSRGRGQAHDAKHIASDRDGKGFDTETSEVGAGSLSFCGFSLFLVVFLGFPAGFLF